MRTLATGRARPGRKPRAGFTQEREPRDRPDLREAWMAQYYGVPATAAYLDYKASLAAREVNRYAKSFQRALVAAPQGLSQPERYREGGYVRRLPKDPWGQDYQYRRPSTHGGQFDVFSWGADGKEGGEGEDADLGNWQS